MRAHWRRTDEFQRRYRKLDVRKQAAFTDALRDFVADIKATKPGESPSFRPGLRVHVVDRNTDPNTHSMTWAMDWFDGRATFQMEFRQVDGEPTCIITWISIGGHGIYRQ